MREEIAEGPVCQLKQPIKNHEKPITPRKSSETVMFFAFLRPVLCWVEFKFVRFPVSVASW